MESKSEENQQQEIMGELRSIGGVTFLNESTRKVFLVVADHFKLNHNKSSEKTSVSHLKMERKFQN